MLLLDSRTVVRASGSNIDAFSNNDQLFIICRLRLWYRNSILDTLNQEQKVNDEEWNGSIGRELLYTVSVSMTRETRKACLGASVL